jgi:acyl-coenzyme A synthetase/AMP-(fatty) acid ligase
VNTLIQAGGKLNQDLVKHFAELMRARGGRFFVMYGQTEATARIAILPADQTLARPSSVGLPIPGGTASILDGDTETTVPDVTGELIYRGPNVMMGYATTRADLAQGDTLGGRLATGDLARIDEDGYLYIAGRAKRDAKIAGIRINLDEVEALLRAYATAAVVYKDERLQVFYEPQQESAIAACRVEVPAKLRIHHSSLRFHPIEKLPVTSSGKIDYQALTELAK